MNNSASVRVSVIILAYRQVKRLDAILNQLREHVTAVSFEVIVVANGVGREVSDTINGHDWVHRIDARVNRGFGGGCNLGSEHAVGEYLVLLNDDSVIRDGWLDGLVSLMDRHGTVGAAASVLVDGNDVVLEAGGAVNHLGNLLPPDRGKPLSAIQGRGPRQATYASGGSMILRTDVYADLGGFNLDYHPAYFEDADLSCRIWSAGHEVWTTTASIVEHAESASTTSAFKRALQLRNGAIFRGRWLSHHHHNGSPTIEHGEDLACPGLAQVLFVDDRVPALGVGSGAGRSRQNMLAIARSGREVLFHPREPASTLDSELLMAGVELVPVLEAVAPGSVDCVVVSRPHNHDVWDGLRARHPDASFVYDAEARFSARIQKQLELARPSDDSAQLRRDLARMLELERTIIEKADVVVAISVDEAEWFGSVGSAEAVWIDPLPDRLVAAPEGERDPTRAIFVAGWEAGADSPNGDAVRWLAAEVLPLVVAAGVDVRVEVTGRNPPEELVSLECDQLQFIGNVDDLDALHRQSRIAVAPTRYGAGVKLKVLDALCSATPVVATETGAEGISPSWKRHILVAAAAEQFADSIVRLLSDDDHWGSLNRSLRDEALSHTADASAAWDRLLDPSR